MSDPLIFVVDDDADHLAALCDLVQAGGYRAEGFGQAQAALERMRQTPPAAIITDLRMPGMDGFALLGAVSALGGDVPMIMLTGHGDVAHAVRAIQMGAEDFLEKPYDAAHLLMVLGRAVRGRATRAELGRLQEVVQQTTGGEPGGILGDSAALTALRRKIADLAPLDVDVVVTGETGTGKELVARALHQGSPRHAAPYLAINCAALPEALFEIEVFGHVRGAFPGASTDKPGKLEAANGGTLVLDEIEAMPLVLQAKLLRALQERQVERLGENRLRPLDLRIVTTSKTDLRQMTQTGAFRADLFYRLAGAELRTEPLRALGADIALLFSHFVTLAARRYGRAEPDISFLLRRDLLRRPWPGNVRELKAAAERHALGLTAEPASSSDGAHSDASLADASLAERVTRFEAREISAALERCRGNTDRAAQILGLPRRTLNDKMSRYGIKAQPG